MSINLLPSSVRILLAHFLYIRTNIYHIDIYKRYIGKIYLLFSKRFHATIRFIVSVNTEIRLLIMLLYVKY